MRPMKRHSRMDMARAALAALAFAAASTFGADSERDDDAAEKVARVHEAEAAGPATFDGRLFAAADEGQGDSYAVCWAHYARDDGVSFRITSKPVPMQGGELEDVKYIFNLHVDETHGGPWDSVRCMSAKTPLRARAKAGRAIATERDVKESLACEHDFLAL